MTFVCQDDPMEPRWGFRVFVVDPQPVVWLAAELLDDLIRHSDGALALGWEPLAEVEFKAGALHTLTMRAENGTWIWRFTDYNLQARLYRLEWPD